MTFRKTEDEIALCDTVERYCEHQFQAGVPRKVFDGNKTVEADFLNGLFELGVGGMLIDPDHSGLGLRLTDVAFVAEILGQYAMPGPFIGHALAGLVIDRFGTLEQKANWLPKLSTGEVVASLALHEPDGSAHPTEWACAISPTGKLSGTKSLVPSAEPADLYIVGLEGAKLALVDANSPGIGIESVDALDRTRAISDVTFSDAIAEPLNGGADDLWDALLILLAADSFGGARRALGMTADYVQERRQFDRAIADFQAVRHELANLTCELECARGLYWYAVAAFDANLPTRAVAAARAKARLTETYMTICRAAVQLHGGIGMTWEFDLQLWLKRAMFNFAHAGVPAIHRQKVDNSGSLFSAAPARVSA